MFQNLIVTIGYLLNFHKPSFLQPQQSPPQQQQQQQQRKQQ